MGNRLFLLKTARKLFTDNARDDFEERLEQNPHKINFS